MTIGNQAYPLIDFLRLPRPQGLPAGRQGSEENQFTPLGAGVNKLIFKRFWILYVSFPTLILF
jgi:hypothetical protein